MNYRDLTYWNPSSRVRRLKCASVMGKTFTYVGHDGEHRSVIVGGADPYLGISLVLQDDHTHIVRCLHGPFDPNYRAGYLRGTYRKGYNMKFPIFLKQVKAAIKSGYLYHHELAEEYVDAGALTGGGTGGSGVCPFGM